MSTKENKLALTYRAEILKKHEAGRKADEALRQSILTKFELMRQCGDLIADCAGDLPDEQFAAATDFLSKPAISGYLKISRQHREPINDLQTALHAIRLALQVSGTLEFPDGHGPQKRHRPNFFSYAEGSIQSLSALWHKFVRQNPLKNWRTATLESFSVSLTPIANILEVIHVELKHRQ